MANIIKSLQVVEFENGTTRVVSSNKRQMARWYALDYLKEKPRLTEKGTYIADVASDYYFAPAFRKKNK